MTTLPPMLVDANGAGVVSLRRHVEGDAPRVLEQCLDPLSQEWTKVPLGYTLDDAHRFVSEAMPGGWENDQEWAFAVDVDGRFGGTVSLRNEGNGRAEIAYGSHPDVRGTGAMQRALRLLLGWGFAEQGLDTVMWRANRGNVGSRRLAWSVGFRFEGTVRQWLPQRGELLDAWVGTLLASDPQEPAGVWFDLPTIESPRLPIRLRAARQADAARIAEGCQDPETARWLGGLPTPYTAADADDFTVRAIEEASSGRGVTLAVAARDDDRLLGVVAVGDRSVVRESAELGYWVHPDARGTGVATEAARLAVRHALLSRDDGGLGLASVTSRVGIDNTASRRVLAAAGLSEIGIAHLGTRTGQGLVDAVLLERLSLEEQPPLH